MTYDEEMAIREQLDYEASGAAQVEEEMEYERQYQDYLAEREAQAEPHGDAPAATTDGVLATRWTREHVHAAVRELFPNATLCWQRLDERGRAVGGRR